MRLALTLALALATAATAQTCEIDLSAVEARIAELEPSYGLVLSDIGCDAPTNPAHILMCNDANATDATCLCEMLIEHTTASLGGTSPYPQ